MHIGYEYQLQQSGVLVPEHQIKEMIEELKKIFEKIKEERKEMKKIIFLGDIKHSFAYEWKEKNYFNEVLDFLRKYFREKDIILIHGNHDTIDYSFGRMKKYHIEDDIAFIHGHELFMEVLGKKVKMIVMGHLHPSVLISEKHGIKKEKYKCFLTGKFHGKEAVILPSFLGTIEGTTVNDYNESYEDYFSIIPKKILINFEVHAVGEDKVYDFGKIKNLE